MSGVIGTCQQLKNSNQSINYPTAVELTNPTTSSFIIGWNGVNGASLYKIERSLFGSGTGFVQVQTTALTSVTTSGLQQGTRYYYRVRAVISGVDGPYSSEVNSFTLPGQVTGLSGVVQPGPQIDLSWNNPSGTETGFKVYQDTNSNMSSQTLISTTTATTLSVTGLNANTTYYFRVRAVNTSGNGAYSSILSVTTKT